MCSNVSVIRWSFAHQCATKAMFCARNEFLCRKLEVSCTVSALQCTSFACGAPALHSTSSLRMPSVLFSHLLGNIGVESKYHTHQMRMEYIIRAHFNFVLCMPEVYTVCAHNRQLCTYIEHYKYTHRYSVHVKLYSKSAHNGACGTSLEYRMCALRAPLVHITL